MITWQRQTWATGKLRLYVVLPTIVVCSSLPPIPDRPASLLTPTLDLDSPLAQETWCLAGEEEAASFESGLTSTWYFALHVSSELRQYAGASGAAQSGILKLKTINRRWCWGVILLQGRRQLLHVELHREKPTPRCRRNRTSSVPSAHSACICPECWSATTVAEPRG